MISKKLRKKSWVRYYATGDLSVVIGGDRLYDRKIAAEERARKRREAAIKAAKTRRERAEAARAAAVADAREGK